MQFVRLPTWFRLSLPSATSCRRYHFRGLPWPLIDSWHNYIRKRLAAVFIGPNFSAIFTPSPIYDGLETPAPAASLPPQPFGSSPGRKHRLKEKWPQFCRLGWRDLCKGLTFAGFNRANPQSFNQQVKVATKKP